MEMALKIILSHVFLRMTNVMLGMMSRYMWWFLVSWTKFWYLFYDVTYIHMCFCISMYLPCICICFSSSYCMPGNIPGKWEDRGYKGPYLHEAGADAWGLFIQCEDCLKFEIFQLQAALAILTVAFNYKSQLLFVGVGGYSPWLGREKKTFSLAQVLSP